MCGVAGYFLVHKSSDRVESILRMCGVMAHRGPDDEGVTLISPESGMVADYATTNSAPGLSALPIIDADHREPHRIALGHRRFSIVDTSSGGHQPFWSTDQRICITINGEIYNYVEVREELRALGHSFRTTSDTEVLAQAYIEWGEACFDRLNGFWSIALYDAQRKQVLLARDRLGKAPLYLYSHSTGLYWASEIKALGEVFPTTDFAINEAALTDFVLTSRRDISHQTMYADITSFPSASYAWINADGSYQPTTYWQLPTTRQSADQISVDEAVEECNRLLEDALRIRMRADVPVGFELSGGMDSSALVGTAATRFDTSMRAFTVAWPNSPVNEEPFAHEVAKRYPKMQYNVITPPDDALIDHLDSFIGLMEQPFRTPSVFSYQTILRSMKSEGLRVSINGTGGDENFAGYPVYKSAYMHRLAHQRRFIAMSRELEPSLDGSSQHSPIELARNVADLGLRKASRFTKSLGDSIAARSGDAAGGSTGFRRPADVPLRSGSPRDIDALLIDYMGDGLMNYWQRVVNQASMGVPLEVRSPFLDYRLIEFSFQLPLEYLMRDGWTKWILRHATHDVLPASVIWRRQKSGFPFPTGEWLTLHKSHLLDLLDTVESPYLDSAITRRDYDLMTQSDPSLLWRTVSLGLWWKRCIQHEALS